MQQKNPTKPSTRGNQNLSFGRMIEVCNFLLRNYYFCTKRLLFLYWERTQENQYSIFITQIGFVLSEPELKRNSIQFALLNTKQNFHEKEKPKIICCLINQAKCIELLFNSICSIRIRLELWISNIGFLESFLSTKIVASLYKNSNFSIRSCKLRSFSQNWGFGFLE